MLTNKNFYRVQNEFILKLVLLPFTILIFIIKQLINAITTRFVASGKNKTHTKN